MSLEAMKQALEALEYVKKTYDEKDLISLGTNTAIIDLRQAIADLENQEPVAWKLVPIKPTEEMLKEMDECSTEGYDERLYAGHAASVYMAAVDAAPSPPQRQPLTDGYFLPMNVLNEPMRTTIEQLIEHAKRARWCNVVVRKDAKETTYEADWIKHLTKENT